MVRYEVSGALSVPEDGVVVFEFNGVETDVFPFPRGEFQAVASHPGNHSVLVAIENHDRTERFVESRAVLVIHAQGHDVPETERGAGAGGGLVLHHALRRGGESKCAMECVPTDTMDDARSEAAPAISARALASGAEAAFLVQVGACDGESFDPVHALIKQHAWGGLLVEPLPDLFTRLQATYQGVPRLTLANVAVTDPGQKCEMLRVPPELVDSGEAPDWALGVASFFSDRTAVGGVGAAPQDYETYRNLQVRQEVTCVTLPELLASHAVKRIDYFQVDAEAYDARILAQLDLALWQPAAIGLETVNLTPEELLGVLESLRRGGYRLLSDGRDLLALRADL